MKVIEKKEWHKAIECYACTSVLEIEFGDLTVGFHQDNPVIWTCCVCKTVNKIDRSALPKDRVVRHPEVASPPPFATPALATAK